MASIHHAAGAADVPSSRVCQRSVRGLFTGPIPGVARRLSERAGPLLLAVPFYAVCCGAMLRAALRRHRRRGGWVRVGYTAGLGGVPRAGGESRPAHG